MSVRSRARSARSRRRAVRCSADCSVARERLTCDGEFAMTATGSFVERLVIGGGELSELSIVRGAVTRRGKPARTIAGQRIERLELKPAARGAARHVDTRRRLSGTAGSDRASRLGRSSLRATHCVRRSDWPRCSTAVQRPPVMLCRRPSGRALGESPRHFPRRAAVVIAAQSVRRPIFWRATVCGSTPHCATARRGCSSV